MVKKGLTKEKIIEAAVALLEREGLAAFSLRNLAASLKIQVSSLYNHIGGQNDLLEEIGARAAMMLIAMEEEAIIGKSREEALFALANVYRQFAKEHTELYRIIMGVYPSECSVLEAQSLAIAKPILRILSDYSIGGEEQIHYQRLIRSVMHGFFANETGGGFSASGVDKDESYKMAIQSIAAQLGARGRVTA